MKVWVLGLYFLTISNAFSASLEEIEIAKRWERAGFGHPAALLLREKDLYSTQPKDLRYELRLTLAVFRGTRWSVARIRDRLKRTAEIFAQCKVAINKASIIESEVPREWLSIPDGHREERDLDIASRAPIVDKPVVFFIRNLSPNYLAISWPRSSGRKPAVVDTAWVAEQALDEALVAGFQTEAHELGHLLGNMGHVFLSWSSPARNLMAAGPFMQNAELTSDQCDMIRKYPGIRAR